jgi:2-polyprenyl-6-methoxyphenol hydroxylase-like FAD-dependent oxidoreductase
VQPDERHGYGRHSHLHRLGGICRGSAGPSSSAAPCRGCLRPLRQIGWIADVFERSPVELVGRGAGITTHPELLEALEKSGAGTRELGIEVTKRITIDCAGRVIGERPLPQFLTSWDRLQRLLRSTIEPAHYHLGYTFADVEQNASAGVRVRFAEGHVAEGDLLVGGDGIRSGVRAQLAPEVQPIYAGYYIWRGAPGEIDLAPETLRSIFPYFTFFLPPRQQVIGYPISGFDNDLRPGHRRYNFIWYRVGDAETLRKMCIDEEGHQHEFSVAPPLIRSDLIAQMRAEAEHIMPAAFLDCLRNIKRPFFTPIYDFSSPRIVFRRTALVGDAASSARPHMGFGVAKAGGDARRWRRLWPGTMTSTWRSLAITRCASPSASALCATGDCSARTSASI